MQISQAKSILLQQQSEWSKVLGETEERQSYINYGIILTVLRTPRNIRRHIHMHPKSGVPKI